MYTLVGLHILFSHVLSSKALQFISILLFCCKNLKSKHTSHILFYNVVSNLTLTCIHFLYALMT
jgi:hypothetical protein